MPTRNTGNRRRTIALALLVCLGVAQSVVLAPVARAYCDQGHQFSGYLTIGGQHWVRERSVIKTCNGNNHYQGQFWSVDPKYRASVWIQNNGVWTAHLAPGPGTMVVDYSFTDTNSQSHIHLCIDDTKGSSWCGWGPHWVYRTGYGYSHFHYGPMSGF